jgi:hypothetical protein
MVFEKVVAVVNKMWRRYPPLVMGRWRPVNEDNVHRKVDLSNQDHCGPCGNTALARAPESQVPRLHAWPTSHGHFL